MSIPQHSDSNNNNSKTGELKKTEDPIERTEKNERIEKSEKSETNESSIGQKFQGIFLSHPASIGETYFEHQRKALTFSVKLIWTGMAALLHALIPALCVNTARNNIEKLHSELQSRSSSGVE